MTHEGLDQKSEKHPKNVEIEVLRGFAIIFAVFSHPGSLFFWGNKTYDEITQFVQSWTPAKRSYAVKTSESHVLWYHTPTKAEKIRAEVRTGYLDGLRGIAALMVFLNHLILSVLPGASTLVPADAHSRFDLLIGLSPFSVVWGGDFAVCVFFVLSGYVLAQFASRTDLSFAAQSLRRYIRLTGPILAISACAWLLLHFHFYNNAEAAIISKSHWLSVWYQFAPDFTAMLRESFYGAYIAGRADYNCNLWTMRIELLGSLYIFAVYILFRNVEFRVLVLALSAVYFRTDYGALFPCGAILAELSSVTAVSRKAAQFRTILQPAIALLAVFSIFMGSFPSSGYQPALVAPWHDWLFPSRNAQMWHMIGAVLLLASILELRSAQRFLESSVCAFLGRVSFVLYLIHIPLLCSLTSWLVVRGGSPYYLIVAGASITTIAVGLFLSILASVFVEEPATRWSRRIGVGIDRYFPNSRAETILVFKKARSIWIAYRDRSLYIAVSLLPRPRRWASYCWQRRGGGMRTKPENQPHAITHAPSQEMRSANTEREAVPVGSDGKR